MSRREVPVIEGWGVGVCPPPLRRLARKTEADQRKAVMQGLGPYVRRKDPAPLEEMRLVVRTVADDMSARIERALFQASVTCPTPYPAACAKGCAFCCYEIIMVDPLRALRIADYLSGFPEARRRQMLDQPDPLTRFGGNLQRAVPCAFLDADTQTCGVYKARPPVCQQHASMDRESCFTSRWGLRPGYRPLLVESGIHVAQAADAGLVTGLRQLRLEAGLFEMVAAARVASEPGVLERWLAGESVFAPAHFEYVKAMTTPGPRTASAPPGTPLPMLGQRPPLEYHRLV